MVDVVASELVPTKLEAPKFYVEKIPKSADFGICSSGSGTYLKNLKFVFAVGIWMRFNEKIHSTNR